MLGLTKALAFYLRDQSPESCDVLKGSSDKQDVEYDKVDLAVDEHIRVGFELGGAIFDQPISECAESFAS